MIKKGRQSGFGFINNYMQTWHLAVHIPRAGVTTGFVPQIFGQDDEWGQNKEHYAATCLITCPAGRRGARRSWPRQQARRARLLKCWQDKQLLPSFYLFSHLLFPFVLVQYFTLDYFVYYIIIYFCAYISWLVLLQIFASDFIYLFSCNHGLELTAYLCMYILYL